MPSCCSQDDKKKDKKDDKKDAGWGDSLSNGLSVCVSFFFCEWLLLVLCSGKLSYTFLMVGNIVIRFPCKDI